VCDDPAWQNYLSARARRIADLADIVSDAAIALRDDRTTASFDPLLHRDRALWSITHSQSTGSDGLTRSEQFYLRHLTERQLALRGQRQGNDERRWLPLVAAINAAAANALDFPVLAQWLTVAFRNGFDIDRLLPGLLNGKTCAEAKDSLITLVAKHSKDGSQPLVPEPLAPTFSRRALESSRGVSQPRGIDL
jgi:hypothetical protein